MKRLIVALLVFKKPLSKMDIFPGMQMASSGL